MSCLIQPASFLYQQSFCAFPAIAIIVVFQEDERTTTPNLRVSNATLSGISDIDL
jgi:hypothetical protein